MKKKNLLCLLLTLGVLVGCGSNDPVNSSESIGGSSNTDTSNNKQTDDGDVIKRLVVSKSPKKSYVQGEKLSLAGLEVKLYTTNIEGDPLDDGVVYSLSDIVSDPVEGTILDELGYKKVTISSSKDASIIETSFTILVEENFVQEDVETRRLVVQSTPKKTNYYQNEAFEVEGLKIAEEKYINGVLSNTELLTDDDYKLIADGKELHDGDILTDFSPRYTIKVESTKTIDSVTIQGTSFTIVIEESEEFDPTLPSATELFTNLKNGKNYTITVSDPFRSMSLTKTYAEHSYFFDSEKDYFGHFGFAEANSQVFRYTLDGSEVVPDIPYRLDENTDEVVNHLYGSGVMTSFADMTLDNLPDIPVTGNTYRLDLEQNKVNVNNFIDIINYGDGVMEFDDVQQVMVSVTGQDTLRVRLTASMGMYSGTYTYVIEVKNVGTTSNAEIEAYLAQGKGAKVLNEIPSQFKTIFENIKEERNYTFTATYYGSNNVLKEDFVDRFIYNACYTEDHVDMTGTIGYADYQDTIFSYIIENNGVVAGEILVDIYGNPYKSLYESVNSFVDLDAFSMDTETDGSKLYVRDAKNINVMMFNTARVSYRNYEGLFKEAYFEYIDENNMKVVVDFGEYGKAEGTISAIGTTTIPEITEFLETGHGPNVDTSFDDLNEVVDLMKNATSYSEDMGYNNSGKHIGYTYYMEHAVFVDYDLEGYEDYGFIDYNGSIYDFTVTTTNGKQSLVLGSVAKADAELKDTKIYPTYLSIFDDTSVLEYSSLNHYFMTTDTYMTGEVCDFMGMSDQKETYIPYGAGLAVDYNEDNIEESTLYLGYFVTTSDGGYYRIENSYANFNMVNFDFIEEFLNN